MTDSLLVALAMSAKESDDNAVRDADHAAAIEREQIAKWLETCVTNGSRLAESIRGGEHWKEGA